MSNISKDQSGFTILELVLATAIFSIVLLLMTYGVIQISRTYIKGYIVSETGNNLRSIQDELTQAIQTSDNGSSTGIYIPASGNWFCINGFLYIYNTGIEQDASNSAFYSVKPNGGCNASISSNISSYSDCRSFVSCNELVGNNIQIPPGGFSINEIDANNNLYQINITLLYGSPNSYQSNPTHCLSNSNGGEFCAYISSATTVQQRV